MHKISPATKDDALELAEMLRPEDAEEIYMHSGVQPKIALVMSVLNSHIANVVRGENDEMGFIYGGRFTETPGKGCIWLLSSNIPFTKKYQREFIVYSKKYVNDLHKIWPVLWNVIYSKNTAHIRWLKWLGARFIQKHENYGFGKALFYEFIKVDSDVF